MVELAPGWNAESGVPRLAGEGDGAEGGGPQEGCGVLARCQELQGHIQ